MRKIVKSVATAFLLCLLAMVTLYAQIQSKDIQAFLAKPEKTGISLYDPVGVRAFYEKNQYQSAWINNEINQKQLLGLLDNAGSSGLDEHEYQDAFFKRFKWALLTFNDSLQAEIYFTDAAVHFFRDMAYGSRKTLFGYNGLHYLPDCYNIPTSLAYAVSEGRITAFAASLEPCTPGYTALKKILTTFLKRMDDSLFREIKITATATAIGVKNNPLLRKLYYLGIIDTINVNYTDAEMKEKLRMAQRLFNLQEDGILGSNLMNAMNVPLAKRAQEVKMAMSTLRWLHCLRDRSPVFVVNIPSASLIVLFKNDILLESKVIVGKRTTPTPTLSSKITDVVLYPYWTVPEKIARQELLPLIKRNSRYLEANNMQVLDKSGRVVDPDKIAWKNFSKSYFPYTLRQSTGCDNSLGLVKLNFYNPYSVYLHDTPWKILFRFNKRYFSHGCMRVEKAIEIAHFLLKGNLVAIDTLEEKGNLRNQAPVNVPVAEPVPVFVLYNTAWIDSAGTVQFNDDIYGKLSY